MNESDVKIVHNDVSLILQEAIADYEERSGKTLYPAHIEQLIIQVFAYRELLVRNGINDAFRQNFPHFARGVALDLCGETFSCYRLEEQPAKTILRFSLAEEHADFIIPENTMVGINNEVSFSTISEVFFSSSVNYVDVEAVCSTKGDIGNGWSPGKVTNLLSDNLPASLQVSNIEITSGGFDVESDDNYRKRIIEAPELFTTCGSVAAYKHHTLAVSQSIIDVDVRSPSAGKVEVTVLTRTGSPSAILISEINSYLSAEERRPLCDTVLVRAPIKVEYSVDASLILLNGYDSINVKNEAEFSLRQYLSMSQGRLGKDILPLEIMTALKVDGVYDVVLHNPTAKKLDMTQWGFCTDINLSLMEQRENG